MILLRDARLEEMVPKILADKTEVQALSYAQQKIYEKVIFPRLEKLRVYADIESASEEMVDALAIELQVPAYRQDYSIGIKRQLVKGAINYWINAGSAEVVEELCQTIFGDAEVLEWWKFGGEEGTYKVRTRNPAVNAGDVAQFEKVAESVKRLSQHLSSIDLELSVGGDICTGGFIIVGDMEFLLEDTR